MSHPTKLTGKNIVVTGAAQGIGLGVVEELMAQNANVIMLDRDGEKLFATAEKVEALSDGTILSFATDVTELGTVRAAFNSASDRLGPLDGLVNNAGITRDNLLMRMKDDEWEDVIHTNLTGMFRMTKLCLRGMMKARFGRIIDISSIVGLTGNPGQTNYSASKAGMIGI